MRVPVALLALLVAACATRPPAIDLSHLTAVDLTYPFDDRTLYWPDAPGGFELKRLAYGPAPGGWFYSANAFSAPEHGGTHVDAPIHFAEHGATVDQIPLDELIAPAVVIDITAQTATDPDYRLTADDVRGWESANGAIASGTIVLLRTGWGSRYPDRDAYLGGDELHFPSFGEDAARLLVNERRVAAIGVDTASIDAGQSKDFIVHQIVSAAGVPGFENIANLDRVPPRGAWIVALPMKIAGGSGAPLRIVALVPR